MRGLHKGGGGLVSVQRGGFIEAVIDPTAGALTTAGAGTITAQYFAAANIYRTGPTGAATDTTDTAANIEAGIGGSMDVGDQILVAYSNQVAQTITIAGGTGVTLRSTKATIASSGFGFLLLRKTGAGANAAYDLYVL